ncbi:endoglucanase E1 [Xylaria nigripes]|nr:endoglucanase E1 [Xylaria nigripes]
MFQVIFIIFLIIGGFVGYIWKAEAALRRPWIPDAGAQLFSQRPLPAFNEKSNITTYTMPLRTRGRDVVDTNGRRFKMASVNWYGGSDELFIPGGLDIQHRSVIADSIRSLGFNSVRLPYSDEMVITNPLIPDHLLAANPDLKGQRALDIFAAVVEALTDTGIAVIVNNHITTATWCCGVDPCDAAWSNDLLGPLCRISQSEEGWIQHWETIMERFVDNPYVIGADLRNEVRGIWGTMPWRRWATAAEKCGNRLLKMNRDWLIIVEGTESGNDLTGVRSRPIVLDVPDRVVYSAHVYSWSGWGDHGGRYSKRSYAAFMQAMRKKWAYLVEGDIAPVWVGEFGAPRHPGSGDANYWMNLLRFLKRIDADFGYWAINPRKPHGNKKEGYALVEDDWITPILDYRMRDMTELIAGSGDRESLDDSF